MSLKLSIAIIILLFNSLAFSQTVVPSDGKKTVTPVQDSSRSGKLFDELAKLDSELFDAAFVSCDQKKFEVFFTEDAEFYHDLAGAKFGPAVRKLGPCPKDKGLSRVLNQASVQVFPVEGYGAIQTGDHTFVQNGSKTVEVAHFVHLWRHTENGWKIARILSFGHQQESAKK
jgi:hypothetical protein